MQILSKTPVWQTTQIDDSIIGIKAAWTKGNTFPTSCVGNEDVFIVNDVQDKGEYFVVPRGVTGVIIQSEKGMVSVAAWRKQTREGQIEHHGPWQIYGEQEKNTVSYYFLGDSQTVFLGLTECDC